MRPAAEELERLGSAEPSRYGVSPPRDFCNTASPRMRHAQGSSPELREIELAYMAKNVAPILDEIDITPAELRFPAPTLPFTTSNAITLHAAGSAKADERTVHFARKSVLQPDDELRKRLDRRALDC